MSDHLMLMLEAVQREWGLFTGKFHDVAMPLCAVLEYATVHKTIIHVHPSLEVRCRKLEVKMYNTHLDMHHKLSHIFDSEPPHNEESLHVPRQPLRFKCAPVTKELLNCLHALHGDLSHVWYHFYKVQLAYAGQSRNLRMSIFSTMDSTP